MVIARLESDLAAIDADRKDKDVVIARVSAELAAVDADRWAKEEVIARIHDELATVNADRRAQAAALADLTQTHQATSARNVELQNQLAALEARWYNRLARFLARD